MRDRVVLKPSSPRKKHKGLKRYKIILYIFAGTIAAALIAMPIIIANTFVNIHVDYDKTYQAKEFGISAQKLTLTTTDGLHIVGHEVLAKEPNAVVILITGIHNPSVTTFFGHSKMLQDNGYSSILLELRAHGESEGDVIGLGYTEHLDVKAVVDYIKSKERHKDVPIIIQGASMGGAVAINSFGQIDEIDGLISISAYSAWDDAFYDTMVSMGAPKLFAYLQKPFVRLHTTLKYGLKYSSNTPEQQIKNAGERPMLIMHSTQDKEVPIENFHRIMDNAPVHAKSWLREGDYHYMTRNLLDPENDIEYSETILKFINDNFGE